MYFDLFILFFIFEKDLFRQAGEDLWRKVREVEQLDSKFALSSWQKVEERLKAPRKTVVLRIRYLASSVAAAVVLHFYSYYGSI